MIELRRTPQQIVGWRLAWERDPHLLPKNMLERLKNLEEPDRWINSRINMHLSVRHIFFLEEQLEDTIRKVSRRLGRAGIMMIGALDRWRNDLRQLAFEMRKVAAEWERLAFIVARLDALLEENASLLTSPD